MGLLTRRYGDSQSLSDENHWMLRNFSARTDSGVFVDEYSALRYPAVWACAKIIAETIAMLPLQVYRRLPNNGREIASDHPVNALLYGAPNDYLTSYHWRLLMGLHLALWGNAYCEIERTSRTGEVKAIWPLLPNNTWFDKEKFSYQTTVDGTQFNIPMADTIHPRGIGEPFRGYSPVQMFCEGIGLGLAAQKFGATFFREGNGSGFVLEHPGTGHDALQLDAIPKIREEWERDNGGPDMHHRIKVLVEGMKLIPLASNQRDSQYTETRVFQVIEAARVWRMPLGKLQEKSHSGVKANVEQEALEFISDTMMPWITCVEQELNFKLFTKKEQNVFYVKFNMAALLRADAKSRADFYIKTVGGPIMTVNEGRSLEDLNPVDGGDKMLKPVNMAPNGEKLEQDDQQEAA